MTSDPWIAALPMYDYPELVGAHDAFWQAVAARLAAAGLDDVPRQLTRGLDPRDTWRHPRLLLGQGCEYPLRKSFHGRVRFVASPRYHAQGCEGARYRSAIVVRREDAARNLEQLRQRRCAINEIDSNSGMNLLRATIAPCSAGHPFFGTIVVSGSHRRSAELVATGAADVAALDCVSFAQLGRLAPALTASLRVLAWTPSSPSLPFITSATTSDSQLALLRSSLTAVAADPALADTREHLLLAGFDCSPDEECREILAHEASAAALGYATLA